MTRDIGSRLEVTQTAIASTKLDACGVSPNILAITLATSQDMRVRRMKAMKIIERSTSLSRLIGLQVS